MITLVNRRFDKICEEIAWRLETEGRLVISSHWQGMEVTDKPEMTPVELQNVVFEMTIPETPVALNRWVQPNLPWAEDHFQERVGGQPLNPPPSAMNWPHAQQGHEAVTDHTGKFSHTYPERFWPKHAGHPIANCSEGDFSPSPRFCDYGSRFGIRFNYGDLVDVLNQLKYDPHTRQAYLPIFFPEDTGAVKGQRVPCSLGYHFMIREDYLHVTYLIRAVDFFRHFRDDVYMALRLAQWMQTRIDHPDLQLGKLTMHTMSMHCFVGDLPMLRDEVQKIALRHSQRLLEELG